MRGRLEMAGLRLADRPSSRQATLCFQVRVLASHGNDWLSNLDTGHKTLGFTVCSSHSSLKPISSGTTQHFVDSDNMEWMASNPHVESIFTTGFDHVFVGTDTSSF